MLDAELVSEPVSELGSAAEGMPPWCFASAEDQQRPTAAAAAAAEAPGLVLDLVLEVGVVLDLVLTCSA